jgi:hypothetical protein
MMVLTLSGLFTGTEVQAHDEKFFQSLSVDMVGVPTFVRISTRFRRRPECNFPVGRLVCGHSHFLTAGCQNLPPDPAQEVVYYHQQYVAISAPIS